LGPPPELPVPTKSSRDLVFLLINQRLLSHHLETCHPFCYSLPLLKGIILTIYFLMNSSSLWACDRFVAKPADPLYFPVESTDVSLFEPAEGWSRSRYETVAALIEPDHGKTEPGPPVIHTRLIQEYERVTGIKIKIELDKELHHFLAERGIDPKELNNFNGGGQGELFRHPKLGNSAIKVQTTTLQFGKFMEVSTPDSVQPLHGNHTLIDLHRSYELLAQMESSNNVAIKLVIERMKIQHRRAFCSHAKQALHRAQQLILPGVVAGQAKTRFFDFVRVTYIGNGFFVREYYPDSLTPGVSEGRAALEEKGVSAQDLVDYHSGLDKYEVLKQMFATLVFARPSAFFSPTDFRESEPTGRQRTFVIYDLD